MAALQEAVRKAQTRFLFEMATGTGKTLTAAAVVKLFIRTGNAKRILFLPHAIRAMARSTPMISRSEVEAVVVQGDVIEDYPEAVRGHSCLMMGASKGRALHVVCSPKADYLAVITAYLPDPAHWASNARERRR